jgi:1,2-phenylacetyl-CoA epoxidase catalytic subunit
MSKTVKRTPFHRQFGEAMIISPTRRAREQREALQDIMDFVIFGDDDTLPTHPYSNEYESGDITMVCSHV